MKTQMSSTLLACILLSPATALAAGCTVSSTGLAFGRYEPLTFGGKLSSTAVTSDASISVSCNGSVNGGTYTLALGPSATGSGDRITTRYLSNSAGGPAMVFNIYRDPAYTSVWGDGVTAGAMLSGSITSRSRTVTHTVYGRIPAGQATLAPGTFSTAMTITITFTP